VKTSIIKSLIERQILSHIDLLLMSTSLNQITLSSSFTITSVNNELSLKINSPPLVAWNHTICLTSTNLQNPLHASFIVLELTWQFLIGWCVCRACWYASTKSRILFYGAICASHRV